MNQEEVREIVKITINELDQQNMLKDKSQIIAQIVEQRLCKYFDGGKDKEIRYALRTLSDDPYIDIIYMKYKIKLTIDRIADEYGKDASTIKRNKRRLLESIYRIINERP